MKDRKIILSISGLVLVLCMVFWQPALADSPGTVSGQVMDAAGPVAGATVRLRNTDNSTVSDEEGHFLLSMFADGKPVEITAWADGYYIAHIDVTPPAGGVTLILRRYHTTDNLDYEWVSPIEGTSQGACGNCHPMIVPQWSSNAHGKSISNPRFYSFYNGTDVDGALQVAPGYLNDFPGTSGNCANCHAPAAGVDGYVTTNMNDVRGDVTSGIHCDYCHKIGGVYLNPANGSVYPNVPGAQSQRMLRPPAGDNIFFGPFDDIHDPDTYLPEISESQFCAPCHQFSFWGTPIYESYEEWQNSSYAAAGVTCQDCHMPPTGDTFFALPEVGGLAHAPERIPSHLQLGVKSTELLSNTIRMRLFVRWIGNQIKVTAALTNIGAGHHVPTDFPGRHMILVVQGKDEQEETLSQLDGPVVPVWGGDQAGLPGKAYAKVLRDVITGESPVISYWKQVLIDEDTRIAANASDVSTYTFAAPSRGGMVTITAELRFRRLFQSIMKRKKWDTPDIIMEKKNITVFTLSE